MPSPILARADALMQRRRQGITGPLDDLPVLTDAIDANESAITGNVQPGLNSERATTLTAKDVDALADAVQTMVLRRLQAELPSIIESAIHDAMIDHLAEDRS